MTETTPHEITPRIVAAFLAQAGHPPEYVPVRPTPHAKVLFCFEWHFPSRQVPAVT